MLCIENQVKSHKMENFQKTEDNFKSQVEWNSFDTEPKANSSTAPTPPNPSPKKLNTDNNENSENTNRPMSDSEVANHSSSDDEQSTKNEPRRNSFVQGSSKSTNSSTSSSLQSQKRPMNAFLIFCKRHRSVVKQNYPNLENRSITKILGEWWAVLDAEQKKNYTELARSYKEAFMKANPNFKWYKTDFKTPPMNQSQSPPPFSSSQPPMGNSTASVPASVTKEKSSSKEDRNVNAQSTANSTPKPPKKRYLESFENSERDDMKTPGESGFVPSGAVRANLDDAMLAFSCPPILDIETMHKVIESRLDPDKQLSLGGSSSSRLQESSESIVANELIAMSVSKRPPPPLADENTASNSSYSGDSSDCSSPKAAYMDENSRDESLSSASRVTVTPVVYTTSASKMLVSLPSTSTVTLMTATVSTAPSTSAFKSIPPLSAAGDRSSPQSKGSNLNDKDSKPSEESPLNLSSTRILHASNQQIIDHFVDKLLGPASSVVAKIPAKLVNMPSTASVNLTTSVPYSSARSSSPSAWSAAPRAPSPPPLPPMPPLAPLPAQLPSSPLASSNLLSISSQQNQSPSSSAAATNRARKERTGKGKRYLEMINESRLGKRTKTGPSGVAQSPSSASASSALFAGSSSTTANLNEDDSDSRDGRSAASTAGSKWISGGFDLEAHIAALPQLGDKHLMSALNHSKSLNGTSSGDQKPSRGSGDNNPTDVDSDRDDDDDDEERSLIVDTHVNSDNSDVERVVVDNNESSSMDTSAASSSKVSMIVMKNNLNQTSNSQSSSTIAVGDNNVTQVAPENSSNSNAGNGKTTDAVNFLRNSSESFDCDGLTALAEVALQQAHCNAISTPSTS